MLHTASATIMPRSADAFIIIDIKCLPWISGAERPSARRPVMVADSANGSEPSLLRGSPLHDKHLCERYLHSLGRHGEASSRTGFEPIDELGEARIIRGPVQAG